MKTDVEVDAIVSAIIRAAESAKTLDELRVVQSKSNAMFVEMNRLLWNSGVGRNEHNPSY